MIVKFSGKECELKEVTTFQDYSDSYPLLFMLLEDEDPDEAKDITEELCYKCWLKSREQGYLLYQCVYKEQVIAVFGLQELYDPICIHPYFRINNLIVLPEYRSQGLGTEIFHVIEELVKQKNGFAIILEVLHANDKAKRFYNNLNYECFCERMWKKLG